MDEFSIGHIRNNIAMTLSGGERRRTEIARTLVSDPKFILLDEPYAGIDPIAVDEIQNIILDLKSRGIGVLITDHNVRETLSITDRSYLLYDGKVLFSGTSKELSGNQEAKRLYLEIHLKWRMSNWLLVQNRYKPRFKSLVLSRFFRLILCNLQILY